MSQPTCLECRYLIAGGICRFTRLYMGPDWEACPDFQPRNEDTNSLDYDTVEVLSTFTLKDGAFTVTLWPGPPSIRLGQKVHTLSVRVPASFIRRMFEKEDRDDTEN